MAGDAQGWRRRLRQIDAGAPDVGYVLGDFIVSTWGMDAMLGLIRANGRLEQVLGISTGEFEQRWYTWLRARYFP